MITQAINLNLIPGQVLPRVNVSQYDSGTRTLKMTLFNGEQIFNVPSGASGFIQGTKPDRTGFQYAATVTAGSNIVTIDITQQMTAVKGEVVCELVLANDDDRIATVNFILYVEAAALADDTVISETDLPLIEEAAELAERIDGIVQQVDEDAQTASNAADKAEAYGTHPPYIGANGNWFVYNVTTQQYEDSGVKAQGPLSGLTDVALSTLTDAQSLIYDATSQKWVNGSVAYSSLSGKPTLGTAAAKDVPASGNASSAEVVLGSDTRLTDARTPVSHTHTKSEITDFPTLGTAAAKDSTNAVTSGSTDLVESGAVYTADKGIYEAMGQNGAKNRIECTSAQAKALGPSLNSGTWSGTTYDTLVGITYSFDDVNKTVTANGTATADAPVKINANYINGDYILSGCPSGGASNKYQINVYKQNGTWGTADYGDGSVNSGEADYVTLLIKSGQSVSNLVFKPMIRDAKDTDDTFQPYAETNQQLTSKTDGLWDNMMDNGAVNILGQTGSTETISPVTFTHNADGTITASSSTATSSVVNHNIAIAWNLKAGTYRFTGCPSGGNESNKYAVEIYNRTDNTRIGWDTGEGLDFTLTADKEINFIISIRNGYNIGGSLVFKPMLSDLSLNLSYDDYVPYAKTNRELTEELKNRLPLLIDSGTINANSSKNISITDSSSALYRLTLGSIGADGCGRIVILGKHPSVANIKYATFDCADIEASYVATVSVSGNTLTITSATNSNCMYTLEKIRA